MVATSIAAPLSALLLFLLIAVSQAAQDPCSKSQCQSYERCEFNSETNETSCVCKDGLESGANGESCFLNGSAICNGDEQCVHEVCNYDSNFGVSFCACRKFYKPNGFACDRIKQCAGNCSENAVCLEIDEQDGIRCICNNGYTGDGKVCSGFCKYHSDCGDNAVCHPPECNCKDGYTRLNASYCGDINECEDPSTCSATHECINKPGSFKCVCPAGYAEQNKICVEKACETLGNPDKGMELTLSGVDVLVKCHKVGTKFVTQFGEEQIFDLKGSKTYDLDVPEELVTYIQKFERCYQLVSVECESNFDQGPITWTSASGDTHTGLGKGGGKCPCDSLKKCDNCACGSGGEGYDVAVLSGVQVPVSKIELPSFGGKGGQITVSPLYCANVTYVPGLPVECTQTRGLKANGVHPIDIDGKENGSYFYVYCDVTTYNHVGVIEDYVEHPTVHKTTESGENINYYSNKTREIIEGSLFCSQEITYHCGTEIMSDAGYSMVANNDIQDSDTKCPCGKTGACSTCRCEAGTGVKDMELIINKDNLPVTSVTTNVDGNEFTIGPLRCAPQQFGIEPNCQKLKVQNNIQSGSFLIDPDGPPPYGENNLDPFLVECEVDKHKGTTVVRHDQDGENDFSGGSTYNLVYNEASIPQLKGLLSRSRFCMQDITFTGCDSVPTSSVILNGVDFDAPEQCSNASCKCGIPIKVSRNLEPNSNQTALPIQTIKREEGGAPATINIGPLKCTEIFPDCKTFEEFRRKFGLIGEAKLKSDDVIEILIDPDLDDTGADAFVVECTSLTETKIQKPTSSTNSSVLSNKGTQPKTKCFDLDYKGRDGSPLTEKQLASMVGNGRECQQQLTIQCTNAPITDKVYYQACGKEDKFHKFVDTSIPETCFCGHAHNCDGEEQCNCDADILANRNKEISDINPIVASEMLPICRICMTVDPITTLDPPNPPMDKRKLRFTVSDLKCGGKDIRRPCKKRPNNIEGTSATTTVWQATDNTEPVQVRCRFHPRPGPGELVILPEMPELITTTTEGVSETVIIKYNTIQIRFIREVMKDSNYCKQDILVFCPANDARPVVYSDTDELQSSDFTYLDVTDEERKTICSNPAFNATCNECSTVKRVNVIKTDVLPVTNITFLAKGVHVSEATCGYVEKDCQAILDNDRKQDKLDKDNSYMIDPDLANKIQPFQVKCDFYNGIGTTKVVPTEDWTGNGKTGKPAGSVPFKFTHEYETATKDQVQSLVEISEFCWQGVKYTCKDDGNKLFGPDGTPIGFSSTDNDPSQSPCACAALGNCNNAGASCNCSSQGMMNQGFLLKPNLPVTEFSGTGEGTLALTEIQCGKEPVGLPKDCDEALKMGEEFGMNWALDGQLLVKPGDSKPMLIHCDYSRPNNPAAIIKVKKYDRKPLEPGNSSVTYKTPFDTTKEQIDDLIERYHFCYVPVKVDCYNAKFLEAGLRYNDVEGYSVKRSHWSSSEFNGIDPICTCDSVNECAEKTVKCNCDVGDEVWRRDAAILDVKKLGPVLSLATNQDYKASANSFLNITVGDIYCTNTELLFNECEMDFQDCAARATCKDEDLGYKCVCPTGWTGSNGRDCDDLNECQRQISCHMDADCENTPGSYSCKCRDGFTGDGKDCVDIDECEIDTHNCDQNAHCVNKPGSFFCNCKKGYRGNGTIGNCSPFAQCFCFGDPHCISFDNKWNHYQGDCEYTLATNDCPGLNPSTPFSVTVDNWDQNREHADGYRWIKSVTVNIHGKTIIIGQDSDFTVNGEPHDSKYVLLTEDKTKMLIKVNPRRFEVILKTDIDLTVRFDRKEKLKIDLPVAMKDKVCGMCGNYNSDKDDDWTKGPQCSGRGVQTADEAVFGDSWATSSCSPTCESQEEPPCRTDRETAEQLCDKLRTSAVFKKCREEMNVTDLDEFVKSCIFDACSSNNSKDLSESVCKSAGSLQEFCFETFKVVATADNDESLCAESLKCGANQIYDVCGPSSNATCASREIQSECEPACHCKEGYVEDNGECILAAKCGCEYDGRPMASGDIMLIADCTESVKCNADGTTSVSEDFDCGEGKKCETDQETKTGSCIDDHTCGENMEYRECGVNSTCENRNAVDGGDACKEGCVCSAGFVLMDGACVDKKECGCVYEGMSMTINQTLLSENCSTSVHCNEEGERVESPYVCESSKKCQTEDGVGQCVDKCVDVPCDEPNTECIAGACFCLEGYNADCGACEDINECETETKAPVCELDGQKCENTEGSYKCGCLDGYEQQPDKTCKDINECDNITITCGPHAECNNEPGTYSCSCCAGYYKNDDDKCIRNASVSAYGSLDQKCCSCSGPRCKETEPVCGSDGNTYPNYRALVTHSCREGKTVLLNYDGECKDTCDNVNCSRPHESCSETGPDSAPICSCPNCSDVESNKKPRVVCGSNGRVYSSSCMLELVKCETENAELQEEENMDKCEGDDSPPLWSEWSECSNKCGKGTRKRSRTVRGELRERTKRCYTTCEEGPCTQATCHNPGQVCKVDESGQPVCECPDCTGVPHDYICAQISSSQENYVQNFPSECHMRKMACEHNRFYKKLEDSICEIKPTKCSLIRNFAVLVDENECRTNGTINIGYCMGGCGIKIDGPCCRPKRSTLEQVELTYNCPKGETVKKTAEAIKDCKCVHESQHENDKR